MTAAWRRSVHLRKTYVNWRIFAGTKSTKKPDLPNVDSRIKTVANIHHYVRAKNLLDKFEKITVDLLASRNPDILLNLVHAKKV